MPGLGLTLNGFEGEGNIERERTRAKGGKKEGG
jgi:hypothetical protein